jgi:hypothetical protein
MGVGGGGDRCAAIQSRQTAFSLPHKEPIIIIFFLMYSIPRQAKAHPLPVPLPLALRHLVLREDASNHVERESRQRGGPHGANDVGMEAEAGQLCVDHERLRQGAGTQVADGVESEAEHNQRRVDPEHIREQGGTRVADQGVPEAEVLHRRVDQEFGRNGPRVVASNGKTTSTNSSATPCRICTSAFSTVTSTI